MAMSEASTVSDCLIVIFGASGDLTKRKLVPALYDLYVNGLMPERFAVMGVSRSPYSDDAFREYLEKHARDFADHYEPSRWAEFAKALHYHAGDSTKSEDFPAIQQRMDALRGEHNIGENVLFYLSVAPRLYDPIINHIGAHAVAAHRGREAVRPRRRVRGASQSCAGPGVRG
jgi:glucose-6-phosphate 1-dehydrogenase